MFAVISSASVACGGHAGDAASMRDAVERAARFGVAIGAHPSYPDRAGFGRVRMAMPAEARAIVSVSSALADAGGDIRYVKPHGALYHAVGTTGAGGGRGAAVADSRRLRSAGADPRQDGAIVDAAPRGAPFVPRGVPRSRLPSDGTLVPRGEPGALLHDPAVVAARAVRLAARGWSRPAGHSSRGCRVALPPRRLAVGRRDGARGARRARRRRHRGSRPVVTARRGSVLPMGERGFSSRSTRSTRCSRCTRGSPRPDPTASSISSPPPAPCSCASTRAC